MSASTSAPFDLGRFTGVCAASGRALEPGERTVAVVLEDAETGAFERRDYAASEWDGIVTLGGVPAGLFCYWRRVVPEPNAKPSPFLDDEEIAGLFESLDADGDNRQRAFRYVLALLLVRRRVYRQVGSAEREGERVMLLVRRGIAKDETPIEVADPGMDAEAVAAAMEMLGQTLRGEA